MAPTLAAAYLLIVFIPNDSQTRIAVSYSLPDYKVLYTGMALGIVGVTIQIIAAPLWTLRHRSRRPTPNSVANA